MKTLQDFKDKLARDHYGKTTKEATAAGICISCGKPAMENCYSEAGRREYLISGLCEKCFDEITGQEVNMKETFIFALTRPAKSLGGDRYEAEIGEPKPWVLYVPQRWSRLDSKPVAALKVTIEHE